MSRLVWVRQVPRDVNIVVIGAIKLARVSALFTRKPSVYLLLQLLFCRTSVIRAACRLPRARAPWVSEQFIKLLVWLALRLQP